MLASANDMQHAALTPGTANETTCAAFMDGVVFNQFAIPQSYNQFSRRDIFFEHFLVCVQSELNSLLLSLCSDSGPYQNVAILVHYNLSKSTTLPLDFSFKRKSSISAYPIVLTLRFPHTDIA
jgi:hypothetical protein